MFHILVVEDDAKLRSLFCTVLNRSGYLTVPASGGREALELLDSEYIDLIISDIMMPGMDGYELIRTLRGNGYSLPILIITAKERFEDKQEGFQAGTDDYMVKPIDVNEMVLRVGALLKRARIATDRRIICGKTTLDYDALTVTVDGEETLLPQKEFYLLYKLMSYPIRFSQDSSSWTRYGEWTPLRTNVPWMSILTVSGSVFVTVMIF